MIWQSVMAQGDQLLPAGFAMLTYYFGEQIARLFDEAQSVGLFRRKLR